MTIRYFVLSILIGVMYCASNAYAQNLSQKGRFEGKHFSSDDYHGHPQVWTGVQNANGDLLFGTKQDIIRFNGIEWFKVATDTEKTEKDFQKVASESYVTKIYMSSSKKVYVGREDNFGYLDYNSKGEYVYFPVYKTNKAHAVGKVWEIFEMASGEILYVGERNIFLYNGKTVKALALPFNNKAFVCKTSCRIGSGVLMVFQSDVESGNKFKNYAFIDILTGKVKSLSIPKTAEISNIRGSFQGSQGEWYLIHSFQNEQIIINAKQKDGNFTWTKTNADKFPCLKDYRVTALNQVGKTLYISTEDKGFVIGKSNGDIVREINLDDNLASLSVAFSFLDKNKNIWLCLDNGIQFIETSSPVTALTKIDGLTSQIEAFDFTNSTPLIASHTDVLTFSNAQKRTGELKQHGKLEQIIFDIETFKTVKGNKSLVIGYDGLFEIDPVTGNSKDICRKYAFQFNRHFKDSNTVYFTLESGIGILRYTGKGLNGWEYKDLVPNVGQSTFSVVKLNGKIYFSIDNEGVGVCDLKTKKYTILKNKQLSSENQSYYIEQFKGKLYVGSGNGIYTLSEDGKSLVPFKNDAIQISKSFKNNIHRIINVKDEKLFVVYIRTYQDGRTENVTGWFEQKGTKSYWTEWPLTGLKNAGVISDIDQFNENEIWFGGINGLYIFDQAEFRRNRRAPISVYIDRMEINGKPFLFDVFHSKLDKDISYAKNSFRFVFHANSYSVIGETEYRYKLDGYSDQWSNWSTLNFANFEKIPEGNYTLKLQARTIYGTMSPELKYEITISPPWYRTTLAYVAYFILLMIIIYASVQISTQRVKRQNIKLEETVKERTKEIAEQNHQLELQKEEITQKTTDILDSIHYAKRIQTTILPSALRLNEMFGDQFVFYRPKDIVSGDFYWAREIAGKMIFAAVDCTGHGVPGALVSIVGNNGLLRAVNEFGLTEPNEILDKLREIVISAFQSEGSMEVKDGMDIALCSIDYTTGTLKFAGANNECVIIRGEEIIELKPDKQPIGQFVNAKPFTSHTFQLEPGDAIYLYTDGYVDQFGGERMKKFKSRPFKTYLSTISKLPMNQQYGKIQDAFDDWKGELEQVDDVCVIGVKYNSK